MSNALLEVRDLHITYQSADGDVPAVRGVDMDIAAGETVGLAGESGCGKSTMATALLRLLPASTKVTGSITLDGNDVLAMNPGQLRALRWAGASIVFQGAQHVLNPVHRIERQINEAIEAHGGASALKAGALLESVGLKAVRGNDYPHELSGGQKQRVMIAMALACDPLLIIADEPTTALDVMVQAQILDLLHEIKTERGLSVLLITHDLSVLTHNTDRVAMMYAGRIIEDGSAAELMSASRHPYTKALVKSFPIIGDMASRFNPTGLAGDPPDPAELPSGCAFHPRCEVATEECRTTDVALAVMADDATRRVACIHVGRRLS